MDHSNYFKLFNLLSAINRAIKDSRSVVVLNKNFSNTYFGIMKKLVNSGIIQSYEIRKKYVIIRLKKCYWKSRGQPYLNLVSINHSKRFKNSTSTNLKKIEKRQRYWGTTRYDFLTTDRGIVESYNAPNLGVGGISIFTIK